VHLLFLWLRSPELAIERVAERVRLGGHDVPAAVVRRRYHKGLRNFFSLYMPLADDWQFLDNSDPDAPTIAAGTSTVVRWLGSANVWRSLTEQHDG